MSILKWIGSAILAIILVGVFIAVGAAFTAIGAVGGLLFAGIMLVVYVAAAIYTSFSSSK